MAAIRSLGLGLFCMMLIAGCGNEHATPAAGRQDAASKAEEHVLNLYIWNDYLAADTISDFERETGIKVFLSTYGNNEELDSKLAVGHTDYDVVVPSASWYERQIRSGYYLKLDKSKLSNLSNMEPEIQRRLASYDPNNDHAVLHLWGTNGIGYNVKMVRAAAGANAPVDSWKLLFDTRIAGKLQKCGIAVMDSAGAMFNLALNAIGKDPNTQDRADLEAAAAALMKIRPYIRYFDTQRIVSDLANGEICVALTSSSEVLVAHDRALENKTGQEIAYSVPKEGSIIWFDSYLIPRDAPHPANAHAFTNYMLRPKVIAAVSNALHSANGNRNATRFVERDILNDPAVYPSPDVQERLVPNLADTEETTRLMTRLWTKIQTGT